MFWKYNSPSSVQIDALLQQENVSLQELMDEDELLQECISQNKKVIDYLTQPDTLEALVSYVVTDPSPDRELKVRFKYANLASELLTSDVPAIVEKVASSSNLLQMLYQFLEKDKPLNPLLASFVSKVFGMLVQRRSEQNWYSYQFTCFQVLDFLKSRGDFVELAVKHIGTSAIMDLLIKLICGVDDDNQELKRGIHQWLNECHLVEQLVEKLTPDCDSEEHSSVDQLLCELIIKGQDTSNGGSESQTNGSQSRLLGTLESKNVINKLMDTLLHEERSESSVSHVINILLTLLSYRGSHKQSNIHHNSIDSINGELDSRNTVLKTVVSRLPDLQKILKQPTKLGKLITAYGMEVERLGSTRLKVVSLIASLIASQDAFVHKEMASLNTLQLLFELFFKFSLNNFLHTQVTHCIASILSKPLLNGDGTEVSPLTEGIDSLNNNPNQIENGERSSVEEESDKEMSHSDATQGAFYHPLLIQLFSECKIIQKILECYAMEEESAAEKRFHNLIGYMGHIREMANDIVQYSKEGPCGPLIQREMKKLPDDVVTQWEEFTLIGLAEVNLKNKIIPLQMPGVSHRDSEDDSEEEFQSIESLVIMNKGFKEGDMDTLGDMPFVEEFKEDEEALNSGAQRLSPTHMVGITSSNDMNLDDGSENNFEKFEEMCSERTVDINQFDDMWKDKEKTITFQTTTEPDTEEEEHHSSSEEEGGDEERGDIDNEFDNIRSSGEKMDVEFPTQEWTEVFDKRGKALSVDPSFNPWQSAPASDISGNNSWADFGVSPFNSSDNPFSSRPDNQCSNFSALTSSNSLSNVSKPSEFDADFSNAFFSSPGKSDNSLGTTAAFPAFSDDPSHLKDNASDAQSVPVSTGLGSLQGLCDVSKTVSNVQPTDALNEEMTISENAESMEIETSSAETSCNEDKKEMAGSENNKSNSSSNMESLFEVDASQKSLPSNIESKIRTASSEEGKDSTVSSIIEVQSSQNISMEDSQ